jgi:UPF0755 protein
VKRAVLIISLLLISITGVCTLWLWHDMQTQLNTPLQLDAQIDFYIKPGTGLKSVVNDLKARGLMKQPYYLLFEARRQGRENSIKAGEYEIVPGTTPLQLLDQIVAGKVKQYALTLIEGWSFRQMMDAVASSEVLKQTLHDTGVKTVMAALDISDPSPEGLFFPDTYHFPKDTSDVEFLRRAYKKMQDVLASEWEQRAEGLPYETPYQALIMASLIEKETGVPHERGQIAGVFVRRLQKGMLLQTDPTVIYAMGEDYDGNIRRKDLSIDSPYNTYRYAGLPPTPIALPGLASIRAALHPEEGNTLYFVAKGDGSHHFSETLSEHNKAVAKYQLGK